MRILALFLLLNFVVFAPSPSDIPAYVYNTTAIEPLSFLNLLKAFRSEFEHNNANIVASSNEQIYAIERMLTKHWQLLVDDFSEKNIDEFVEIIMRSTARDSTILLKWGLEHRSPEVRETSRNAMGLDGDLSSISLRHAPDIITDRAKSPVKLISQRDIEKGEERSRRASLSDEDFAAGYVYPTQPKKSTSTPKPSYKGIDYFEGLEWSDEEGASRVESPCKLTSQRELQDNEECLKVALPQNVDLVAECSSKAEPFQEEDAGIGMAYSDGFDWSDEEEALVEDYLSDSEESGLGEMAKLMLKDKKR